MISEEEKTALRIVGFDVLNYEIKSRGYDLVWYHVFVPAAFGRPGGSFVCEQDAWNFCLRTWQEY
jgi:hypothetical protein